MTRHGESSSEEVIIHADFAAHRQQYAVEHSPHGPVRARMVRLTPGIVGSGIVPSETEQSEYNPGRSIMSQALALAAPNLFSDADSTVAEQRMAEREMDLFAAEELRH